MRKMFFNKEHERNFGRAQHGQMMLLEKCVFTTVLHIRSTIAFRETGSLSIRVQAWCFSSAYREELI